MEDHAIQFYKQLSCSKNRTYRNASPLLCPNVMFCHLGLFQVLNGERSSVKQGTWWTGLLFFYTFHIESVYYFAKHWEHFN